MLRLTALAVAVAAVATPATAAPKPKPKPKPKPCPAVSDPRGDAAPFPASLDIVSADVVIGRATVVAVMSLAGPPVVGAPHGAGGATWSVGVNAQGTRVTFRVRDRGPLGTEAELEVAGTSVPAAYTRDMTRAEIRWAAPRSRVLPGRSTVPVTDTAATTLAYGLTADTATTRRPC